MATVHVWPGLNSNGISIAVYAEDGVTPIPAVGGAVVPVAPYYQGLLSSGVLLDHDPLDGGGDPIALTPVPGRISVKTFGAVGDGVSLDSVPLRAAVTSGVPLYWPPGVYLVDVDEAYWADPVNGHALHIRDVDGIDWEGYGATIKMNDATWFTGRTANLKLQNCSNVSIKGLTFDGNRDGREVAAPGGASCVDIMGGSNVKITDVKIVNACMEGLHLAPVTPNDFSTYPADYEITNLQVENAYRNGVGVIAGRRITFRGGYGRDTNGTAPEAGFDAEPNEGDLYGLEGLTIDGMRFDDNAGEGLLITGSQPEVASESGTGNGTVTDLSVYGPTKVGTYVLSCIASAAHGGTFRFTDPDGIILSSSLVCNPGAGVATDFYVGGFHIRVTDGSTDFGTDKIFNITGGQTQTRGVQLDNISGSGNALGLLHLGVCRDVQCTGLSVSDEATAFTNSGLVYVSRAAHGMRLSRCDFSAITGADDAKACIYVDDTGIGHRIDGITGRELYCSLWRSPNHGLELSNVTVDGAHGTEAVIYGSGNNQVIRNYTARRCDNYSLRLDACSGSVVEGVTVYDPLANSVRIAAAGVTLRQVNGYHSGNAPGAFIQFDAGATPKAMESCQAIAAGTPYGASAWTLPTSKAFRCSRVSPHPFSTTTTWNPGSIGAGSSTTTALTVSGALVGDRVSVRFSPTLASLGFVSKEEITATDTVSVTITNTTGGAVDPPELTVTLEVEK